MENIKPYWESNKYILKQQWALNSHLNNMLKKKGYSNTTDGNKLVQFSKPIWQ